MVIWLAQSCEKMCDCSVGCVCSLSVFDWPWPAHSNIRGKVNLELLIVFREFDQLIGPLPQYQLASTPNPADQLSYSWCQLTPFLLRMSPFQLPYSLRYFISFFTAVVTSSAFLQHMSSSQVPYSLRFLISFLTAVVTLSSFLLHMSPFQLSYSLRYLFSFLTAYVTLSASLQMMSPYTFLIINVTFSASLQLTLPYQLPLLYLILTDVVTSSAFSLRISPFQLLCSLRFLISVLIDDVTFSAFLQLVSPSRRLK